MAQVAPDAQLQPSPPGMRIGDARGEVQHWSAESRPEGARKVRGAYSILEVTFMITLLGTVVAMDVQSFIIALQ